VKIEVAVSSETSVLLTKRLGFISSETWLLISTAATASYLVRGSHPLLRTDEPRAATAELLYHRLYRFDAARIKLVTLLLVTTGRYFSFFIDFVFLYLSRETSFCFAVFFYCQS
jgi:hypothetical protein